MGFLFEKLEVYQKSLALASELIATADSLPSNLRTMSDQLRRAAVSIPSNIAEGNSRFHKAERMHFFRISRGSAFECATLIDLCSLRNALTKEQAVEVKQRLEEVSKILFALAKNADKKAES